ncbi:MAG: extracellular solute-binding protein [Lachnospiraceae bacterium]|nr:extracellular solute-binding protein [Lachnospiraceae bacterium]
MKKLISIFLICVLCIVPMTRGTYIPISEDMEEVETEGVIYFWYTDPELVDYVDNAAFSFYGETGIRVVPTLVSGLEYLEVIQQGSLHTENGPDVYLIENESIEKAVLSGLAIPVTDEAGVLTTDHFPQVALEAASYNNKIMGYPLNYETAVFLYNETYLEQVAKAAIQAEKDRQAAEDATQALENGATPESEITQAVDENGEVTEEALKAKMEEILPTSMIGILEFANNYDPVDGMDAFFKWDVSDVFFSYGFAGSYLNVGGPCGDDKAQVNLYNSDAMYALSVYQDFNQFFSMESEEIDYETIVEEFKQGKIMFTLADTGIVEELEKAKQEETFPYEYGISNIEMLNTTLQSQPLSVTNVVVVNGYSTEREAAELFAKYLTCDYVTNLYSRSGSLSAYQVENPEYEALTDVRSCYEGSVSLPKIVEAGNYWILAEICYTDIWEGEDVNAALYALASKVHEQIFGEEAFIGHIDTPEIVESYIQSE